MKTELLEFNGIPIYRYTGNKADYALLLLPGFGGYGGYYDPFNEHHIRKGVEIWGMDPPGHGRSAQRRGHFTMEQYLEQVVELAGHIRRTTGLPVLTLGSSLGSGPAYYALELTNDLAGGISMGVAIGAAGGMDDLREQLSLPDVVAMRQTPLGEALDVNVARFLDLEKNYGDPALIARVINNPLVAEHYDLASLASFVLYKPKTPPSENKRPWYCLVGGADPFFPSELVHRVYNNIGGPKKLTIFPDGPHQLMFLRTEEFSNLTDEWARQQI